MTISTNVVGQQVAMDGRQGIKTVSGSSRSDPNAVAQTTAAVQPDEAAVKAELEQLQKFSNMLGRKVEFNVNKELNRVIIKVIDPATDKVIKEIPSEDIQKLQLHIQQALGVLVDEKR